MRLTKRLLPLPEEGHCTSRAARPILSISTALHGGRGFHVWSEGAGIRNAAVKGRVHGRRERGSPVWIFGGLATGAAESVVMPQLQTWLGFGENGWAIASVLRSALGEGGGGG